jgi:hypothetical protein
MNIDTDIDPPSVMLIVALLGAYFMLVVPINYWTLKRFCARWTGRGSRRR